MKQATFISVIWCFILFFATYTDAQNIKTVQLRPVGSRQFSAIVPLGSALKLSFDDLDADSKEYQYKIEKMTYNWKPSKLSYNQYIRGFDQNYITDVTNSFNTLQPYTHYSVTIPNQSSEITKSGNYLISVLDDDDEVILSRKCVFFEPKTDVGVSVLRSRDVKNSNEMQTVHFIVNYPNFNIQNPSSEIKAVVMQNNNWQTAIYKLKPRFFGVNKLIYNYNNKTNFWAGNEFLNFDNKQIRSTGMHIAKTEMKNVFHNYLYANEQRAKRPYTYYPDINGQFVIRTLSGNNANTEADYAYVHFYLEANQPFKKKEVYVYGAFNDFKFNKNNKMKYSKEYGMYKTSILLKQGFYNYMFATVDKQKKVNLTEIDGNYYQTENEYTVLIYYRPFGELYDRVIGVGNGFYNQNR